MVCNSWWGFCLYAKEDLVCTGMFITVVEELLQGWKVYQEEKDAWKTTINIVRTSRGRLQEICEEQLCSGCWSKEQKVTEFVFEGRFAPEN